MRVRVCAWVGEWVLWCVRVCVCVCVWLQCSSCASDPCLLTFPPRSRTTLPLTASLLRQRLPSLALASKQRLR